MGKLTAEVFNESCCDGGSYNMESSAQPCGCDLGADYISPWCERHREKEEPVLNDCVRGVDPVGPKIIVVPVNPLDEHVRNVVDKTWNFAGRITDYEGHLQNAVLGLVGEAGEVADQVKKMLYHTEGKDHTSKLRHELGDVFYYLGKTLQLLGLTMEECLAANKEKLESRHPELGKVSERFNGEHIR